MGRLSLHYKYIFQFAFLLVFLSFIMPHISYANSAPIYQPNPTGNIVPFEDSPIIVEQEQLQFFIRDSYQAAHVFVNYEFYNPLDEEIQSWLAFPYTPRNNQRPQIFVNDIEIHEDDLMIHDSELTNEPFLQAFHSTNFIHIDPVTGEIKPNWNEYDIVSEAKIISFPVIFLPQEHVQLTLKYEQNFGVDKKKYIQPIHLFEYFLQPASAWKEFHDLTISVIVPSNSYYSSSLETIKVPKNEWKEQSFNIPSEVVAAPSEWEIYKGIFATLPADNFAFSYLKKEGLLLGVVHKEFYDVLGISVLLISGFLFALIVSVLLTRFKKWIVLWIIGPIVSFLICFFGTLLLYSLYIFMIPASVNSNWLGGYGFIVTLFLLVIYSFSIYFPIMFLLLRRKHKSNRGEAN